MVMRTEAADLSLLLICLLATFIFKIERFSKAINEDNFYCFFNGILLFYANRKSEEYLGSIFKSVNSVSKCYLVVTTIKCLPQALRLVLTNETFKNF